MEIDLKNDFEILEEGTSYLLPVYRVVDGKGLEYVEDPAAQQRLNFVRGSKVNEEEVEKREGTLHEHLLAVMIHDLQYKNGLVPSREGALVITKLQEAQQWLLQRQIDRKSRDVEGTYQK